MDTTSETKVKSEITEVAPCRKKIEITVAPEGVDTAFDEAYGTLRDNVQVRGFRKGHTPRRVLERRFAKEVGKDVGARLFRDHFVECMKEKNLAPMGDPDIELDALEAKPGEVFAFSTEVDVRPAFDLPEYKGLQLKETVEPATEEEIQEQIERVRKAFASYAEASDASQENDILEADVVVAVGEEELVNEKNQRIQIEGTQLFGLPCEDLVKQLGNLTGGKEKRLELKLPDDHHREELRGKQATVSLTVHKVLRPELPALDDAMAKRVGMNSLDALRDRVRENIESERQEEARRDLERQVMERLVEQTTFELPEAFLKRQTEANLVRTRLRLARMGATQEFLDEKAEELQKSSAEETARGLRWTIISDAIAEKEEVEVSEAELQAHIEALARSYQMSAAKMLRRIQDMNGLPAMVSELRDIKVIRLILDGAQIEKTAPADKKE